MKNNLITAVLMTIATTILLGIDLSIIRNWSRSVHFSGESEWTAD